MSYTDAIELCGRYPSQMVEKVMRVREMYNWFIAKSDGSILELRNCISLRYNFYGGWRNVKLFSSGECCIIALELSRCKEIRDCYIFKVNDLEVFLQPIRYAYSTENAYLCKTINFIQ